MLLKLSVLQELGRRAEGLEVGCGAKGWQFAFLPCMGALQETDRALGRWFWSCLSAEPLCL